eukprot:COSAG06_NODE_64_length_26790_cov_7.462291_4_plen_188_part_00
MSFCPPKSGAVCSKSEIRYEGTLFAIDTKDSTVTLQNGASNACVVTARYLAPASQPPVPCEPAHTDRELAHTDRDVLSRRWQFAVPTVRSFGTEDRPAPSKIAASTEVYEYIIFRGSDIKDLQVRLPRPASGMVAPAALSPDSSPPASPDFCRCSRTRPAGRTRRQHRSRRHRHRPRRLHTWRSLTA